MIKTKKFDDDLNKDLQIFKLNRKTPIDFHGSYQTKNINSIISDIDLRSRVRFDNSFFLKDIKNMLSRINKNKKIVFIGLKSGLIKGFDLPWRLDEDGYCFFDIDQAETWFKDFSSKKMVPDKILKKIEKILNSETIKISDIVDIQLLISPFTTIVWEYNDILSEYKIIDGIKYNLIDSIKEEAPVLSFIYSQDGRNFIPIDYVLLDNNYKQSKRFTNIFNSYYTEQYYRILKYLRWKIKDENRAEYFKIFEKIEKTVYILTQIYMYNEILHTNDHPTILKNIYKNIETFLNKKITDIDELKSKIKHELNNKVKDAVYYYNTKGKYKIKEKYLNEIELLFTRGLHDSKKSLSKTELRKRNIKLGIDCPFFKVDLEEFEKLYIISRDLLLNLDEFIECVYKISDKFNKQVIDVVQIFNPQNYIIKEGEKLVLKNKFTHIAIKKLEASQENLKKLQLMSL